MHPLRAMIAAGQNLTLEQWSAKTGIPKSTIANRIRAGWTPAQAVDIEYRPPGIPGPKTDASKQSGYMRERNAERRRMAKKLGICQECQSTKAAPGRTRCPACLSIDSFRSAQRQKAA